MQGLLSLTMLNEVQENRSASHGNRRVEGGKGAFYMSVFLHVFLNFPNRYIAN